MSIHTHADMQTCTRAQYTPKSRPHFTFYLLLAKRAVFIQCYAIVTNGIDASTLSV